MKKQKYIRQVGEAPKGIQKSWREVEPQAMTARDFARRNWHFLPRSMRSKGSLTVTVPGEPQQATLF